MLESLCKVNRMTKPNTTTDLNVTRERLIRKLNTDLASEYQAIVAFIVYSQIQKRAAHADIARELELHAAEDFQHAKNIAKQIDYLGGTPCVRLSTVKTPNEPIAMQLSSNVGNHAYPIDMASLLGIDASPSDHLAADDSWRPRQARINPAGIDSAGRRIRGSFSTASRN
jgi:hypothetical protein